MGEIQICGGNFTPCLPWSNYTEKLNHIAGMRLLFESTIKTRWLYVQIYSCPPKFVLLWVVWNTLSQNHTHDIFKSNITNSKG